MHNKTSLCHDFKVIFTYTHVRNTTYTVERMSVQYSNRYNIVKLE